MPQPRHVIRQENLRRSMGKMTQTEFAKYLSERLPIDRPMSKAYLGQLLQDLNRLDSGEKQGVRAIGDEKARDIEKALGKPHGWMDERHDEGLYDLDQPLENKVRDQAGDISALAYAVGALVTVVSKRRPDEGAMIARLLKDHVDPKHTQKGGVLDAVFEAIEAAKAGHVDSSAAGPANPGRAHRRGG